MEFRTEENKENVHSLPLVKKIKKLMGRKKIWQTHCFTEIENVSIREELPDFHIPTIDNTVRLWSTRYHKLSAPRT